VQVLLRFAHDARWGYAEREDRVTLSAETATVLCRLVSQIKEATQMHRLGAFLLTVVALAATAVIFLIPTGITWG
jgi:hypothetical protein